MQQSPSRAPEGNRQHAFTVNEQPQAACAGSMPATRMHLTASAGRPLPPPLCPAAPHCACEHGCFAERGRRPSPGPDKVYSARASTLRGQPTPRANACSQ
ncbi:uncharacterized protein Tco025E_08832 [Trypanosoma conorhini]|uniref:Uncharacterized protein n=1 Tax=Trypanosoma conorhini TaxID=83891 RepID=A0A422N4B1_9TRYP|nr:uncharacterized protein Tco025E_08832 [Trypanosoma conorhini]RNF00296.1 hypothetical protein Tco025E_08832 [Trypanosoma conorhini]